MIVDCYTHIWESPAQLGRLAAPAVLGRRVHGRAGRADEESEQPVPNADTQQHLAACAYVDITMVLGFRSYYLEAHIPNSLIANYVRKHPDKLIGFAGIDPTRPKVAIDELCQAREEWGMKGICLAPAAQNLHPAHSNAMRIYEAACERKLPVMFHQGIHIAPETILEFARPSLLDEVARTFPSLKIIVAHLGFPWVEETIVLLGKHANVYADISGLLDRPWPAYNALLSAYQQGVMGKLLFGSGFPWLSAADCIEALYSINQLCHGTNLPVIPREQLRGIVECEALSMLGIRTTSTPSSERHGPTHLLRDDIDDI